MRYFDAHCHVQFDAYSADRDTLVARMHAEEVAGIVVGVDITSSETAVRLAEEHPHLYASVGLHPNRVAEGFDETVYRTLAAHPKVVAVGECGLDYFRPEVLTEEVKREQERVLRAHIALADALDKPLIIHARPTKGSQDAYQDLIRILTEERKSRPRVRGDIHFFVGGVEEGHALVELGFTLSFTAVITFARDYDAVIRALPLTSILAETDAPYVAPLERRGERNDPLAVVSVVKKIAGIRGEDEEEVRQALLKNALRTFGISLESGA